NALAGRAEEAPDRDAHLLRLDVDESARAIGTEDLRDTLAELADRWPMEQLAPVGDQAEARLRRHDREPGEAVDDVPDVRCGRAQELPARRRRREEIGDDDRRARRARLRTGSARAVRVGVDGAPDGVRVTARHQANPPGGGDARQRLAAEAERAD